MHVGNLSQDSPSLFSNLKRYFKEDEVLKVTLAYALAAKFGALNETGVVRTTGSSFNPRPARVAQILMTELRDFTADTICCALLSCTKMEEELPLPDDLKNLEATINDIKEALRAPNEPTPTAPCEACVYAVLLDDIRHLHMTDFPIEYIKNKITYVQGIIENQENFKENQMLVEKVRHALDKLEKFIQSGK